MNKVACAFMCIGAMTLITASQAEPSDPAQLLTLRGKSALSMTFQPIGGQTRQLVQLGKPTVVVGFASWCEGCIEELPTVLKDYARYGNRVQLVGLDYLDNPKAGDALIAKYKIPFEVERYLPNDNAPPPYDPNRKPNATALITLNGFSASMLGSVLPQVLPQMKAQLPPRSYQTLSAVAEFCKTHSVDQCGSYATAHHVAFGGSPLPSPPVAASPNPEVAPSQTLLSLPHTFIIDANGVVRANIEGYESGKDPIAQELSKLGIR